MPTSQIRRQLTTIASVLPLALLLTTVVLWVRSNFVSDSLLWQSENRCIWLVNMNGRLRLQHASPADEWCRQAFLESPKGFRYERGEPAAELDRVPGSRIQFDFAGFLLVTGERWQENLFCALIPHWFICAMLGLLPLLQTKALFSKRARGDQCHRCGYDLRATPDRCPECGAAHCSARGMQIMPSKPEKSKGARIRPKPDLLKSKDDWQPSRGWLE